MMGFLWSCRPMSFAVMRSKPGTVKSAALKPQSNEPKSDLMKEDN